MGFSKIYAKLITKNPMVVIILSLILFGLAIYGSGLIENVSMDYKDMLPQENPVVAANTYFGDTFGSPDSVNLILTVDSNIIDSNEPSSVLDPRVIRYSEVLANYLRSTSENFESVDTVGSLITLMNGGIIPKSEAEIIKLKQKNDLFSKYISDDLEMQRIIIRLKPNYDTNDVIYDLEEAMTNVEGVVGVKVRASGAEIADTYVRNQLSSDMARTGMYSIIGIIVILILTFMSLKYAFLPLVTIIVGVNWTFGFIGFAGIGMTSATSGVLSMIMGIGIDFGIQMINRFRQELKKSSIEKAMEITLTKNLYPMFTTTLAAIIGFQSMGLGQLSFMQDMGNMMMYGVIFCFFAAITIVPALTIVIEKILAQVQIIKKNKVYKVR